MENPFNSEGDVKKMNDMKIEMGRAEKRTIVAVFAIFLLIGAALVIRAQYGLDLTDESYYLAAAKRFWSGDRPFREEWFPTQLIGILLLPVYGIYVTLSGGTEGIILFVRLLYILFSEFVSIFLFFFLIKKEKMDGRAAILISLAILLYARANIITLSYYSIGFYTFLLYLIWKDSSNRFAKIAAGVSFSVSVLCMPYLIFYFCGSLILKIVGYFRKRRAFCKDFFQYLGMILSAAVFLVFCAAGGDFQDIFKNLPLILMDPTHQDGIWQSCFSFLLFMGSTFYRFLLIPLILESVGILCFIKKGRNQAALRRCLCIGAYLLFFCQCVYLRTFFEGGIIIAFLILAVQISFIEQIYFQHLWLHYAVPGLGFGICWIMGSNVGQRVFNMGALIACIWGIAVIWEHGRRSRRAWKAMPFFAGVLLLAVLGLIRFCDVYRDAPPWRADTRIDSGPAKGIYTTAEKSREYQAAAKEMDKYAVAGKTLAVAGGVNSWAYLMAEADCGAYTVWNNDYTDERNEVYYQRYPDKIPDVVFAPNESVGAYTAWRFSSHGSSEGYGVENLDGWIKNLVEENKYECIETDCGRFYVKGK